MPTGTKVPIKSNLLLHNKTAKLSLTHHPLTNLPSTKSIEPCQPNLPNKTCPTKSAQLNTLICEVEKNIIEKRVFGRQFQGPVLLGRRHLPLPLFPPMKQGTPRFPGEHIVNFVSSPLQDPFHFLVLTWTESDPKVRVRFSPLDMTWTLSSCLQNVSVLQFDLNVL